ncbi:MAG: hypothetical protein ACXW6R_03340 [Candidatus Binatia bacterium]
MGLPVSGFRKIVRAAPSIADANKGSCKLTSNLIFSVWLPSRESYGLSAGKRRDPGTLRTSPTAAPSEPTEATLGFSQNSPMIDTLAGSAILLRPGKKVV